MRTAIRFLTAIFLSICFTGTTAALTKPKSSIPRFESEAELQAFLKRLTKNRVNDSGIMVPSFSTPVPAPPAAGSAPLPGGVESVAVSSSRISTSITNNQEVGVDEGDIVKLLGNHLVVLRRGRLFTISLAGGTMKPVDSIDAFPPGVNADGDWYDEMLVSGNRIVVIGYSYERVGTQIVRFRISADGRLSFEDAYQLRSSDYYSSRNYASRLIGSRLVLYSERGVYFSPEDILPALRRWNGTGGAPVFSRIPSAQQVYISAGLREEQIDAVHSVIDCDLTKPVLACKSTSVFGAKGRVFYVAADAAYVHSQLYDLAPRQPRSGRPQAPSILYRLPLNGAAPSAIGIHGMPVDQFSFQADAAGLNLFLTDGDGGDMMWAAQRRRDTPALALARVPLGLMGDGGDELPFNRYRVLPTLGDTYDIHNRFVGGWLLYGSGSGWSGREKFQSPFVAVSVKDASKAEFSLPHGVDRIEVMGDDAVAVGGNGKSLYFSTLLLGGKPQLGSRYELKAATEAESRSHGFFFHRSLQGGAARNGDGMLGLPVARAGRPAYRQLFDNSAAVVFLSRRAKVLHPAGELEARQEGAKDDACMASCVDWYGNARPIFIGQRVFALMGYELVEGRTKGRRIAEVRRMNFAPPTANPRQ